MVCRAVSVEVGGGYNPPEDEQREHSPSDRGEEHRDQVVCH